MNSDFFDDNEIENIENNNDNGEEKVNRNYLKLVNDIETLEKILITGSKNLVEFYKLFLCDVDEYKEPADFHYKLSDILLNSNKNFAIQAFRESGKSSYTMRAFPLFKIMYPSKKKYYILLIKNSATESARIIKQIAEEVRTNPLIAFRVEQVLQETLNDGGAYEIMLKNGSKVRIEGKGKGSSVRGAIWGNKRPDIIILDDIQDVADMQSETTMEKDWEWFLSDITYLSKKGRIFLIGNNLGEKCLIERVFQYSEQLNFECMRIPVADEYGNPTWKAQYTKDEINFKLEAARKVGKIDVVMRELFCESMPDEYRVFKKEYFKYYPSSEKQKIINSCNLYLLCDLAISQSNSADYTALSVVGVNANNHLFIIDIVFGRFTPSETIEYIFELVQKYPIIKVGIEKVAFQSALEHFLVKEMPKRNVFFEIKPLIADRKKELRIKTLQPRFTAGTVWFEEDAEYLTELERELLTFPNGKHDDLIDSIAYFDQISEVPIQSKFTDVYESLPAWSAW